MSKTFIFLHGSWHAAWNWHKVTPILEAGGHKVISLNLPGHGQDKTPASRCSLELNVKYVTDRLRKLKGKAVLVAHSRNGIVISQAAEVMPEKIESCIYLAAYLVPNGKSMMEYGIQDKDSLVARSIIPNLNPEVVKKMITLFRHTWAQKLARIILPESRQSHMLKKKVFQEALYHDCDTEITELAKVLLTPEPNWPGFTPLRLSTERYGSVPKAYIKCLQDRAVSPFLQNLMLSHNQVDRVVEMDCSHSPFFSQPEKFSRLVTELAEAFSEQSATITH